MRFQEVTIRTPLATFFTPTAAIAALYKTSLVTSDICRSQEIDSVSFDPTPGDADDFRYRGGPDAEALHIFEQSQKLPLVLLAVQEQLKRCSAQIDTHPQLAGNSLWLQGMQALKKRLTARHVLALPFAERVWCYSHAVDLLQDLHAQLSRPLPLRQRRACESTWANLSREADGRAARVQQPLMHILQSLRLTPGASSVAHETVRPGASQLPDTVARSGLADMLGLMPEGRLSEQQYDLLENLLEDERRHSPHRDPVWLDMRKQVDQRVWRWHDQYSPGTAKLSPTDQPPDGRLPASGSRTRWLQRLRAALLHTGTRPIHYSPEKYRSIEAFQKHRDFPAFLRQYDALIEEIRAFATTHRLGPTDAPHDGFDSAELTLIEQRLATFQQRIRPADSHFDVYIAQVWGDCKQSIESICTALKNDALALHERISATRNLTEQCLACAGGIASELQDICRDLSRQASGVREEFRSTLRQSIRDAITKFLFSQTRTVPGAEIHGVNMIYNDLRGGWGLDPQSDDLAFQYEQITDPTQVDDCRAYLQRKIGPERIVARMADRYLDLMREAVIDELRASGTAQPDLSEPIPDTALAGVVQRLQATAKVLAQRFGEVPMDRILVSPDDRCWSLAARSTLVAPALARSLHDVGVIEGGQRCLAQVETGAAQYRLMVDCGAHWVQLGADGEVQLLGPEHLRIFHPDQIAPTQGQRAGTRRTIWGIVREALHGAHASGLALLPQDWARACGLVYCIPLCGSRISSRMEDTLDRMGQLTTDIEQTDHAGRTAFLRASARGDASLMKWLMVRGASVTATDHKGRNGLHRAMAHGDSEAVQLCLNRLCDLPVTGHTRSDTAHWQGLPIAMRRGNTQAVQAYISAGLARPGFSEEARVQLVGEFGCALADGILWNQPDAVRVFVQTVADSGLSDGSMLRLLQGLSKDGIPALWSHLQCLCRSHAAATAYLESVLGLARLPMSDKLTLLNSCAPTHEAGTDEIRKFLQILIEVGDKAYVETFVTTVANSSLPEVAKVSLIVARTPKSGEPAVLSSPAVDVDLSYFDAVLGSRLSERSKWHAFNPATRTGQLLNAPRYAHPKLRTEIESLIRRHAEQSNISNALSARLLTAMDADTRGSPVRRAAHS